MTTKTLIFSLLILSCSMLIVGCKSDPKPDSATTSAEPKVEKPLRIPPISADSAYVFVEDQVNMGARVPGSEAHALCRDWIVNKMKGYGLDVRLQPFVAKTYTGFTFDANNIIASYKPEAKKRIVLAAHWDTRFIADQDDMDQDKPILGADDGGSGVAILIEIARVLRKDPIDMGIDFVFFDAEDQGDSENQTKDTYCLGSQYWSKNIPQGYLPDFGILFDMVGSKGAIFRKEAYSMTFAGDLTNRIWDLAHSMGYGHLFPRDYDPQRPLGLTDDHFYVNTIAKIPMTDIINLPATNGQTFGHYWHTHDDNMDIIDKSTLGKVGQVALAVIYRYDANRW